MSQEEQEQKQRFYCNWSLTLKTKSCNHLETHPTHPGQVYLSHFQTSQEAEGWYGSFIGPNQVNQLTSQPPASLPEMLWLAIIFLFGSYLSHFKSDFHCVKNKVGSFNSYNLSSYVASIQLVSQKCHNILGNISTIAIQILMVFKAKFTQFIQFNQLPNLIYLTKSTKFNLPSKMF